MLISHINIQETINDKSINEFKTEYKNKHKVATLCEIQYLERRFHSFIRSLQK